MTDIDTLNEMLWKSVLENKMDGVKEALKLGANINYQNVGTNEGATPLWLACKRNSVFIAKYLIDQKADKTIKNWQKKTPFDATESDVIKKLLDPTYVVPKEDPNKTPEKPENKKSSAESSPIEKNKKNDDNKEKKIIKRIILIIKKNTKSRLEFLIDIQT